MEWSVEARRRSTESRAQSFKSYLRPLCHRLAISSAALHATATSAATLNRACTTRSMAACITRHQPLKTFAVTHLDQ